MSDLNKTCFVLMPFVDKYREVYDHVYKPICKKKQINCWRVDDLKIPGSITRDIIDGIITADIIIADLTSQSPNVFYELGVAHSTGNKTIMTTQNINDVPFDIANYRVIQYEQTIDGSKLLTLTLSDTIDEIFSALDRTNNPVQDVLHRKQLSAVNKRVPILRVLPVGRWSKPLKEFIRAKKFIFVDELISMDFEKFINIDRLGKKSQAQLFYSLLQLDLSDNQVKNISEIIMSYNIDVSKNPY